LRACRFFCRFLRFCRILYQMITQIDAYS
jgi:hypothetical protein